MTNEDFTTYTEVDEGADITVTSPKVEWVDMDRNVTSYVYKDFGAGNFGDVDHDIELQFNASQEGGHVAWWTLANILDDLSGLWGAAEPCLMVAGYQSAGTYQIYLRCRNPDGNDTGVLSANTLYYCTLTRVGSTGTLKIYSDSGRTDLLDTLSVTCGETTFKYLYACIANNSGTTGHNASGFSQNFDLKEVPPPPEHFMVPKKYW